MEKKIKNKTWFIKLTKHEYWPLWVYYTPVFIQHFILSLSAKSLFYFLKTNPAINEGFILSDSKHRTLRMVPEEYLPKTVVFYPGTEIEKTEEELKNRGIGYPLILKPDIGFRGIMVFKAENREEFAKLLGSLKVVYLIQEFVDYPLEIGVLYYRIPGSAHGCIPSVTLKEFLSIRGDGRHTFKELIYQDSRAILQAAKLKQKYASEWNSIISSGREIVLEQIGNHNRGTKFINGNHLADAELLMTFDELNSKMPGFYFGRFDIRVKSIEDLKAGRNFKILEVNGVGAEPTHIYDSNYPLIRAWKDLLCLWRIIYRISMKNRALGEDFPGYSDAKKRWESFKKYRKEAFS